MVAGASGFSASAEIATDAKRKNRNARSFILEAQLQPVVGDTDAWRQIRFTRLRQLVAKVSEECLARPHFRRNFQRLRDTEMSWVRFAAESVDDEHFDLTDLFGDRVGNRAAIAEIGNELFPSTRKQITVHD